MFHGYKVWSDLKTQNFCGDLRFRVKRSDFNCRRSEASLLFVVFCVFRGLAVSIFMNSIRTSIMVVCILAMPSFVWAEAPGLASVKFEYESQTAGVYSTGLAERRSLAEKYTNALHSLQVKAQQAGDLDRVKVFLAEQDRFARERTAPAAGRGAMGAELENLFSSMGQNMRNIAVKEAKDVLKLSSAYDASLESLQKELTKAGKIEQAIAVQEERKTLASSADVRAAKEALASGTTANPASVPLASRTNAATTPAQPVNAGGVSGMKAGDIEKKLVGTRWTIPVVKDAPPGRAIIELLKDGYLKREWTTSDKPLSFRWKVRDDGVVELHPAYDQKFNFLLYLDSNCRAGTLKDPYGGSFRMKCVSE